MNVKKLAVMNVIISLSVFAFVCGTALVAGADSCPPNSGYVSCCSNTDGRGCGTSQTVTWTTAKGGDWKQIKNYCYPQDVNWCKNNMRGDRAHLVNTICDFVAPGYTTNGWSGSNKRCCALSINGCQ